MSNSSLLNIAVFDLNQTVYNKSSKEEFFKFIIHKEKPKAFHLLSMGVYSLGKKMGLLNKTTFKENFFHYLDNIPPQKLKAYAYEYWAGEWPLHFNPELLSRIEELRSRNVAICFATGALDCYAQPLFEHFLQPDYWLATRTQYVQGRYKIEGRACKDWEKIRRINQLIHPTPYQIVEAYSDENEAILQLAQKGFLSKDGKIVPRHP
ncbi:haloacid dehalogenase-like hydrolase [Nafulsella turpanensis]|uniref:haloacid dehalogenase-like hydrolase n=1 Tax=Nafulsella turpanensis TaxID=1265690 RepID=UPI000349669A|nr:haloacid dehalogenase-like hydrolase [Nafulsella turpanensis]